MASSGNPLGIGLAIDFASLDADLSKVANRIEQVGSEVSLKVGSLAGLAAKGGVGADQIGAQVSQIGMSLSQGMASGVRASSAVLLSLGARINAMVDRIGGVMITMFNRIDTAMKGHRWTNLLTGLSNTLGNFASGSGKALSPLDKAMGGAFGGIAKRASSVFNTMFVNLGETMTKAMDKAAGAMTKEMANAAKMIARIMISSMNQITSAVKDLAATMSTAMLKAIDSIAHKMKDLRVGAEATATSMKGVGAARPYMRQLAPPQKEKPIIDVNAKIKPPSAAEIERLAKSVNMKVFSGKELTPLPKPQKQEFSGAMPKPQMFKEFQSIIKDTVAGIKGIPVAFQKAVASGNQYAVAASRSLTVLLAIDRAAATSAAMLVRLGAGFAAMGLAAAAAIGRTISFFSTLGSVGKVTYGDLFRGNNIFVAAVLASTKTVYHLVRGLFDLVTLNAFRRVGDDAKKFGGAVQTSTGLLGRLSSSVGRLGVELAAAFGVVGLVYKVVQFFEKGVKSAADLNTEVARSKLVFGESFGPVAEQVEKNTKAFNVSKAAQMELTSSLGSMAQGFGASEAKSADLAVGLNELAVNAMGIGVSFTDASEAMKAGLSGRAFQLKQLAVNIDENSTKAFAWKTGIAGVGQELTTQQTLMARAGQIMRGLSYVQGSLAAGANLASVQFQRAGGGMALFAERIGELLLPAVQSGTRGFNALMGGVLDLLDRGAPAIQSWSSAASESVQTVIAQTVEFGPTILANLTWAWEEAKKGPLGFVIEGTEAVVNLAKAIPEAIGIGIRNAGTLWEIAKLQVGNFVNNAMAYLNTIPGNFGLVFNWLANNWDKILVDMLRLFMSFISRILEAAMKLGTAIKDALTGKGVGGVVDFFKTQTQDLLSGKQFEDVWNGFEKSTAALPEMIKPHLDSVEDQVAKLYEKIGQNELKIKPPKKPEEIAAAVGKKPPILAEDKSKEYKLGGALEAGSKEAFSAISRGASGRSSTTDAVKQNVTVSRDIHKAVQQQTEVIKNKAFAPALNAK